MRTHKKNRQAKIWMVRNREGERGEVVYSGKEGRGVLGLHTHQPYKNGNVTGEREGRRKRHIQDWSGEKKSKKKKKGDVKAVWVGGVITLSFKKNIRDGGSSKKREENKGEGICGVRCAEEDREMGLHIFCTQGKGKKKKEGVTGKGSGKKN